MSPPPAPLDRAPPRDVIIGVRDLVVGFGSKIVMKGLDLDIYRGEILGFVGPSGQGKSVLTRTILGLVPKRSGTIEVFGEDVDTMTMARRRQIEQRWGVLFQQGALFSALTVKQNIQMPMREHLNLSERLLDEFARLKIEMVGLKPDAADKLPSELSGGMIKRAALARSLALDPEILFLDEPTSGLDPDRRRGIRRTRRYPETDAGAHRLHGDARSRQSLHGLRPHRARSATARSSRRGRSTPCWRAITPGCARISTASAPARSSRREAGMQPPNAVLTMRAPFGRTGARVIPIRVRTRFEGIAGPLSWKERDRVRCAISPEMDHTSPQPSPSRRGSLAELHADTSEFYKKPSGESARPVALPKREPAPSRSAGMPLNQSARHPSGAVRHIAQRSIGARAPCASPHRTRPATPRYR